MRTESKLKIGHKVSLRKNRYTDSTANPWWEGKCGKVIGTIDEIDSSTVGVLWDNGVHNIYLDGDLDLVSFDWDE